MPHGVVLASGLLFPWRTDWMPTDFLVPAFSYTFYIQAPFLGFTRSISSLKLITA